MINLKFRRYLLYAETFFVSGLARCLVRFVPMHRLFSPVEYMWNEVDALSQQQLDIVDTISRIVAKVANYVPWRFACYEQGLTAKLMLRLRGVKSQLVFGVAYSPTTQMNAHAWLQCGNRIVTGEQDKDQFTIIAVYG